MHTYLFHSDLYDGQRLFGCIKVLEDLQQYKETAITHLFASTTARGSETMFISSIRYR